MLKYVKTGQATDLPPLLIAHGLYGSARNWGVIAKRMSDAREVVSVDMRNHGESRRCCMDRPWLICEEFDNRLGPL